MSVDGEICAYVRGCKDKKLAIDMAAIIFGISDQRVISALQSYGLLDENRKYIEPVRMTGMEATMEKRKINYPSFAWSPKRQAKLKDLYQRGKSVPDIAAYFKTDESTVYKAINKYDLVRVTHNPAEDVPEPAPKITSHEEIPKAEKSTVVPPAILMKQPLHSIHPMLKDLLHFVVDASNHNNDVMAALDEGKSGQVCFELGQQCVKLSEAEKIIKNLLNTFPEP